MSKYCYDTCFYKIITTKDPFSNSSNIKVEHKDPVDFKGLDQCFPWVTCVGRVRSCLQGFVDGWGCVERREAERYLCSFQASVCTAHC